MNCIPTPSKVGVHPVLWPIRKDPEGASPICQGIETLASPSFILSCQGGVIIIPVSVMPPPPKSHQSPGAPFWSLLCCAPQKLQTTKQWERDPTLDMPWPYIFARISSETLSVSEIIFLICTVKV